MLLEGETKVNGEAARCSQVFVAANAEYCVNRAKAIWAEAPITTFLTDVKGCFCPKAAVGRSIAQEERKTPGIKFSSRMECGIVS